MAEPKFQTLSDFIADPFGRGSADIPPEWKKNAETYILQRKIRIMKILDYKDSFFYNIEVPSESKASVHYDVVIQFIPPNNEMKGKDNIRGYYVKFFSNSPSFVYKYAALYDAYGFLIEPLADKLGSNYMQIPEKTNPNLEMAYDKSIYFASLLILKNNYFNSFKDSFFVRHTTDLNAFVRGVLEFDTVMTQIETENMKKSVEKSLKKDLEKARKQPTPQKSSGIRVIGANAKKHGSRTTMRNSLPRVVTPRVAKKVARAATKSTRKS